MSIKNCQAIQKSCLDRESNAWFTLGSESEGINNSTCLKSLSEQTIEKPCIPH